jgi:hypothetical protein
VWLLVAVSSATGASAQRTLPTTRSIVIEAESLLGTATASAGDVVTARIDRVTAGSDLGRRRQPWRELARPT